MNSIRFSGMASGMDTESIVKQLMQVERMRVDKYTQTKQVALWRQEQYNEVNKAFANFVLDVTKEFGVMRRSSGSMIQDTSSLDWVKRAISSNEDIFTASANTDAPSGSHKITVHNLAEGITGSSTESLGLKKSDELSKLGIADGSVTFEVDGKEVKVDFKATDTIDDLMKKISNPIDHDNNTDTPDISLGIQANFDDTTGRLFLSTKETGEKAQIKITSDDNGLFTGIDNKFKLAVSTVDASGNPISKNLEIDSVVKGRKAKIDFDGATGLEFDSNQFTINGIELDLKTEGTATVSVDTDVDGVYDKIKFFVDKYNDLVEQLNKKTSEKQYRSYQPLTAEQKEAMSEDDIKLWEEKAKSGLLRNDDLISRTLQNMRGGLYEEVEGVTGGFNEVFDIGITTGGWKDKGKLVIDEDKLKKAIKEDADGVMELLFKPSSITDSDANLDADEKKAKRKDSGILNRLFDDVVDGMKTIVDKAGPGEDASLYRDVKSNILIEFVTGKNTGKGNFSFLDQDVFEWDKKINKEQDRLISVESRHWAKFTAMEKALSQMQSQSGWIASQLGGM